jgi:hypothetical protein
MSRFIPAMITASAISCVSPTHHSERIRASAAPTVSRPYHVSVTSCATAHERAVNPSSARIGMQSMYNLLSAPSTSMLPQAGLTVSSKHTLPHAMSFPTSALKLTLRRYPGKKQHQYHCLRCSHWTLHNSPKCQLSNVHKGFQSHLGSILPRTTGQQCTHSQAFNPTLVRFCRLPIRYSSSQHRVSRKICSGIWVLGATGVCWIPSR